MSGGPPSTPPASVSFQWQDKILKAPWAMPMCSQDEDHPPSIWSLRSWAAGVHGSLDSLTSASEFWFVFLLFGPVDVGRDTERTHSSFPAPAIPIFIPGNSTRDKALCRLLDQRFCFLFAVGHGVQAVLAPTVPFTQVTVGMGLAFQLWEFDFFAVGSFSLHPFLPLPTARGCLVGESLARIS